MSDTEVLEKAIQKAIAGGWYSFANDAFGKTTIDDILIRFNPHGQGLEWTIKGHESNWSLIEALIYSHDFTKALWGERPSNQVNVNPNINSEHFRKLGVQNWQVHLQQMVIADDPLRYLADNI